MQDLTLALVQADLYWHNPEANRGMLEEMIWSMEERADVIILPEMFTTGFTMEADSFAEPMNLHTFKWMKQMAAQTNALVLGSYIVKDGGGYFNRLMWMQPDGHWQSYDKRHLFRMAGEHEHYSPGSKKLIGKWKGWNICPLICYDLRFPVWSRNVHLEYDLLLYVANWPEPRIGAWDILLKARAIENLCFVAGVNRVGVDGLGVNYCGHSAVIDPKGREIIQAHASKGVWITRLSGGELEDYRAKFPAHFDADSFNLSDERNTRG
jgi:predicted amidohydrolase